jgi:hypothetical protein
MPKYQVIRTVEIITEVTAKDEDQAFQEALAVEMEGKAEYCELTFKANVIKDPVKTVEGRFRITVEAVTWNGADATKKQVEDALCVENLDYGNCGVDFTADIKITSSAVHGPNITIIYEAGASAYGDDDYDLAQLKNDIDEMIMWWGGNGWSYDNGPKITVKAI